MPKGPDRSRYTAVITVYLTDQERATLLRWCRWIFPNHCQLSAGQLITHAFEIYGRTCQHMARDWCDVHPDEQGWEPSAARPTV